MRTIRLLLGVIVMMSLAIPISGKTNIPTSEYEIEGVNRAVGQGGAIVKVTIITKKKDAVNHDALAKAAVHGILFKGYQGNAQSGMVPHRAMCDSPSAETTYAEFFLPFFNNGQYNVYVQCQDDTRRVIKAGNEFRVSCNVIVAEGQLRQDLEKAGVIKSLNSGW